MEKNFTKHIEQIKLDFLDSSYEIPYLALEKTLSLNEVDDSLFKFILSLEDKLVVTKFLEEFENFSESQIDNIEEYIEENLKNKDKLFVASLIEVANDRDIISIYDSCLDFIENEKEDDLIIIESIYLIYEHLELLDIERVFSSLEKVINSKNYYQNCQIVASFYLLRMSGIKKYLDNIIDLIKNGQELNRDLLKYLLAKEYNQPKYFSHYNKLMSIV